MTRLTRRLAPALAAAAAALAACDRVPANAVTKCESAVRMGAAKTDVLFVIDDSGSMSEEQAALRDSLYAFIDGLAQSGIQNDFQIGVTNTSIADFDGNAVYPLAGPYAGYSAAVPYPAGRLVAVNPGALTDPKLVGQLQYDPVAAAFTGDRVLAAGAAGLVPGFKANVLQGVLGSGKEQPFRAAQLALEAAAPGGVNAGFLRPGARLAVVILTDEDDCSEEKTPTATDPYVASSNDLCHQAAVKAAIESVSSVAAYLDGPIPSAGGEPRNPVVAAISGFDRATLAPTGCATSYDVPTRIEALLDAIGPARTVKASICEPDFQPALEAIADRLVPQQVPLEGALPDVRMLVATVTQPDGTVVPCPVAEAGTAAAATAGAVYTPPLAGRSATVTFQNACTLHRQDQVDLHLVCAG